MGMLRPRDDGRSTPIHLRHETRVGRSEDNHLVLARSDVSGTHAVIRWTGSTWLLRDLRSRNGTFLNGQPIEEHPLAQGDAIAFAGRDDEVWVLVDTSPPGLLLESIKDPLTPSIHPSIHVDVAEGLRALPSDDEPRQTLLWTGDHWVLELDDGARGPLVDGQELELGGRRYRASVPPSFAIQTTEPEHPFVPWALDDVVVEVEVQPGEDDERKRQAKLTLRNPVREAMLGPGTPFYVLAYLAEERVLEAKDTGVGTGWVSVEQTLNELGLPSVEQLNVRIHRVRKAVSETGLANGTEIIQRRRGELRCGVEVERLRVR